MWIFQDWQIVYSINSEYTDYINWQNTIFSVSTCSTALQLGYSIGFQRTNQISNLGTAVILIEAYDLKSFENNNNNKVKLRIFILQSPSFFLRIWCSLHGSPRRRRPRQGWSRGRKGYWSCWDRFPPSRMQMARPSTAPSMPSRSTKEERESSTASAGGPEPLEPRRRRWRREGFGSERDVRWGCGFLRVLADFHSHPRIWMAS